MKRILIIGAATLLSGGVAFAQGTDPNGGGGDATGSGAPPPPGGAPAAGADTGAAFSGGGPVIDRPLVLAKGGVGVYGDFDVAHFSATVAGMSFSSTAEGLHFGGGYGLTDKVTIGAEYAFTLNSFEIKGPLTLYGAMSLMHTDKLDIGASADLVIDLNATSTDAMGMVTSSTTETFQAGLGARYKLTPKVAVFTSGGAPVLAGGGGGPGGLLAPGPLGEHLSIGFQSGAPITFAIPVGVALQATPQIYAWVDTALASLSISNSSNAVIFKDFIPLDFGGYYTANKNLDVGAFLDFPDLKNNSGIIEFGISARYYK